MLSHELKVLHTPLMSPSLLSFCRGVIQMFPILPRGDSDVNSENSETCGQRGKQRRLYLLPGNLERGTGKAGAVS